MIGAEKLTSVSNNGGKSGKTGGTANPPPPAAPPSGGKGGKPAKAAAIAGMPWYVPAAVAILVLGYFIVLHSEMFDLAGTKELDQLIWQRKWMLFVSIEAFALAAAGAVLGVQVQRGRVDASEKQRDQAQEAAAQASQAAEAAKTEAASLRARAESYVASLEVAEASVKAVGKQEAASLAKTRSQAARHMLLGE